MHSIRRISDLPIDIDRNSNRESFLAKLVMYLFHGNSTANFYRLVYPRSNVCMSS